MLLELEMKEMKTSMSSSTRSGGFGGPSNSVQRIKYGNLKNKEEKSSFYYFFNTVCIGKSLLSLLLGIFLGSLVPGVLLNTSDKVPETHQKRAFVHKADVHSSGFGGINNLAHIDGAKAYSRGQGVAHLSDEELSPYYVVTDYNTPATEASNGKIPNKEILSIKRPNILNAFGHYLHDEFQSPYASHLYDLPSETLKAEQERHLKQMASVREEWGAWTDIKKKLPNDHPLVRKEEVIPDLKSVPLRDLPNSQFPLDSWQMDPSYVSTFMDEAKALIRRVREGIYAEYGFPIHKDADAAKRKEVFEKFSIGSEPSDLKKKNRIAWLSSAGMDGMVRKLLHSLITNDDFYVVLSGHSAAAGHGNNFHQSSILKGMHYILEPVFDKLGMRLISRNLGMGGVGTLHFGLAGKSLLGETDVLIWDSGMTENGKTSDLFNKQAIFAGARMPVLFTYKLYDLVPSPKNADNNETATADPWVGGFNMDFASVANLLPPTLDEVQAANVPWAARYMNIGQAEDHKLGADKKFNSICWENRTDVTPTTKQDAHPGSQVGWHPGWRTHQFLGRSYALVLLEALFQAFDLWERGIEADGFPLSEKYWHVTDAYHEQREAYRTQVQKQQATAKDDKNKASACEQAFAFIPRICRDGLAMSGYGMWTPRNMASLDLVEDIVQAAPNGYKPNYKTMMAELNAQLNLYDSFDLLPHAQQIPDGEVDVHAIAIATTNSPPPPPSADGADNNNESNNDDRRQLRMISRKAIHNAMQLEQPLSPTLTRNMIEGEQRRESVSPYDFDLTIAQTKKLNQNEEQTKMFANINTSFYSDESSTFAVSRELEGNEILTKEIIISTIGEGNAQEEEVVPGRGWIVMGWNRFSSSSYPDGSTQSIPNCRGGNCMASGHSDSHYGLAGNSLSGWLVMNIPSDELKNGIIIGRMEWWCNAKIELTASWTTVNDGKTTDTTPLIDINATAAVPNDNHGRGLKASVEQLVPDDFHMDVAFNGKIIHTYDADVFRVLTRNNPSKNCAPVPLLNDASFEADQKEEFQQIGIRFRTESMPQQGYCISHLYYS